MAGDGQPLTDKVKIVNPDGTASLYMQRWAQARQIDISAGITEEQAQQIINDWAAARHINTTAPIAGGGPLSGDLTLTHAASGVAAATYGDATHVPQMTVDAKGHVTAVANVPITGGGGGGSKPTIVQSATARSATGATPSLTLTFPAATTVGNSVVFLVSGFGGSTTKWSIASQGYYIEAAWNTPVVNQGTGVLAIAVAAAATAYTFNIANPNGAVNVLALELSNLASITFKTQLPNLVSKTLTGPLFVDKGFLSFLLSESDANAGPVLSATSGLTLSYDANSSVGHSGTFHQIADSLVGKSADITFTNVPSSPVFTTVVLKGQ